MPMCTGPVLRTYILLFVSLLLTLSGCRKQTMTGPVETDKVIPRSSLSKPRSSVEMPGPVLGTVLTSAPTSLIVSGVFPEITVLELNSFKTQAFYSGHTGMVYGLAMSGDGRLLVSGGTDKTVRGWSLADKKQVLNLTGHTMGILSVDCSKDGRFAVSGSRDCTARVWDLHLSKEVACLSGRERVHTVVFSPDSHLIAMGGESNEIYMYEVGSWKEKAILKGHTSLIKALAFSPDGTLLLSGSWDKSVRLWNVATSTLVKEMSNLDDHVTPHSGDEGIFAVAWVADGSGFYASGNFGRIYEVDARTYQVKAQWQAHTQAVRRLLCTEDGNTLISAGLNEVKSWNIPFHI